MANKYPRHPDGPCRLKICVYRKIRWDSEVGYMVEITRGKRVVYKSDFIKTKAEAYRKANARKRGFDLNDERSVVLDRS